MKTFCPNNFVSAFVITTIGYFLVAGQVFAQSASLSLDPNTGTFNKGCPVAINVNIDTGGADTDGVDAYLSYDTSRMTALSVTKGTAYSEIPGSNIDATAGKVVLSGIADFSKPFKGKGTIATINFNVKENSPTGATQVNFDFTKGSTSDSNVAQTTSATDILGSVVNGTYTIGSAPCSANSTDALKAGIGVNGKSGQGQSVLITTPSGQLKDSFIKPEPPRKELPQAGSEKLTFTLAIIGTTLTILGIIGLSIL